MGEGHLIDRGSRRLADFVREHSGRILAAWERRVRSLRPAARLERPVLLDHMPQFLEDIAAYVDEVRAGHDVRPSNSSPRAHAIDRLELGYDITEVVAEYKVLRECMLDLAVDELAPAVRSAEMPRLHAAIDLAIAESVVRYTSARERTMKALDRISEAALDQADVVGFLDKLLTVLSETTEVVDVVKILLREGDELVLRAGVGPAEKELIGRFRQRIGEGLAGRIAAERKPIFVPVASADPDIAKEGLRMQRAVYGVPLVFRDELVGVALMGSTTAYQFSDEDKLLFRTMAARATGIIVQGQLLQRERAAHEEAEKLVKVVAAKERRFRSVLEASADIIWTRTADGRVAESSPGWSAFTGQPLDEQLGFGWLEAIHPDDRERVREKWIATVESKTPWLSEYRLRRKSGDYAEVISRGVPVMADGAVQEWVGTVTDVTGARIAERTLRESEKDLRASLEFRDRMMGVLSHDLRNPLGVIMTSAQGLQRHKDLPETVQRSAIRIANNAERMARMIRDLLDYTRARGTGLPMIPAPADLGELCKQMLDSMEALYSDRKLVLQKEGDTRGEWDVERLLQVISNLVSNAVVHGRAGTPVVVALDGTGEIVELAVHNEGEPIPPEVLPHVFEPFARGNASSGHGPGLGLGLFIVKEIVVAHGGTIDVDSGQEEGTTFVVRLPRRS